MSSRTRRIASHSMSKQARKLAPGNAAPRKPNHRVSSCGSYSGAGHQLAYSFDFEVRHAQDYRLRMEGRRDAGDPLDHAFDEVLCADHHKRQYVHRSRHGCQLVPG